MPGRVDLRSGDAVGLHHGLLNQRPGDSLLLGREQIARQDTRWTN
jgi:hypothetical protein